MAKQIEAQITVTHYPRHPFGKYAGTYSITTRLGRENYEDDPMPLSGCTLNDPLSDDDKALLCALSLARIDAGGQFAVDYAALRAHLQSACDVLTDNLSGLTWPTVLEILRPADRAQQEGAGNEQQDATCDLLTFDVAQRLFEVSRPTLQRAVRSGELRSYRKADKGKHRVRVADLERLFGRRKGSQL